MVYGAFDPPVNELRHAMMAEREASDLGLRGEVVCKFSSLRARPCCKHGVSDNAPAAFLRDRRRLADSRLHLDPGAGRRFGLERTGEQMLGAAHSHTDAKK